MSSGDDSDDQRSINSADFDDDDLNGDTNSPSVKDRRDENSENGDASPRPSTSERDNTRNRVYDSDSDSSDRKIRNEKDDDDENDNRRRHSDEDNDVKDGENIISSMRRKKSKSKSKSKKNRDREDNKEKRKSRNMISSDDDDDDNRSKKKKSGSDDDDGSGKDSGGSSEDEREFDSSEEDEEDEELTEADKQFIVDDEEEEDGGANDEEREKERRRKKRRRQREEEEDLDDDDLDLLDENFGRAPRKSKFKRLRKRIEDEDVVPKKSNDRADLSNLFQDDEEGAYDQDDDDNQRRKGPAEELEDEEAMSEDLDDFIIDDEEDNVEETEEDRLERLAMKKERRREAKINLGQQFGISDDVWHEIQDLFGDGSDYAYALKPVERETMNESYEDDDEIESARRKPKTTKITDIYEPSEIAERLLTEEDEAIRMRDIPERFQILGEYHKLADEELSIEVGHIVRHLMSTEERQKKPIEYKTSLKNVVVKVLQFLRENHLEVPFIYANRKDHFLGYLNLEELWVIFDLDLKFQAIEQRRKSVRSILSELRAISETALVDNYPDRMLTKAASIESLSDVMGYLQLHYHSDLQKCENNRRRAVKRSVRRTPYEDAKKEGIDEFAKLYHIDVKTAIYSYTNQVLLQAPDDVEELPFDAASRFIVDKSPFNTELKVIEAARMMLAQEIATDPHLIQYIREIYLVDAVITVTPTEKGKREIQPLHPYYPFKYLTDKRVPEFENPQFPEKSQFIEKSQFLQMYNAESEGLIEISVRVDDERSFLDDIAKYMINDYTNEYAEAWNEERRRVVEIAVKTSIHPQVSKWLKEKLYAMSSDWVANECRILLQQKLNVAPFSRLKKDDDDDWDEDENDDYAKVMAISWGEGDRDSATIVVCLNEKGRISSRMKLTKMQDREGKEEDLNRLLDKIRDERPAAIVFGGWSILTFSRLIPEVSRLLERLNDDTSSYRSRGKGGRFPVPDICMVEDDVARIAMTSKRYEKEFPDFPPLAKYCISLARKVQCPLLEYANLFNTAEEYKLLRLHPLQTKLGDEKLKQAVERAFINVVNQCGVDINEAVALPHRSNTLQFVSGLGPRKARFILTKIAKLGGFLESRADLIRKKLMTSNIFMNCASFIRIREKDLARTVNTRTFDVLDDTRIHPENYELARKMAADVLEVDDVHDDDDPSAHVKELMEDQPERVELLMLDDYAKMLEEQNNELKRITLDDIKLEIMNPYEDRRSAFQSALNADILTMLTNETEETLRPGMVVSCEIYKVENHYAKARLTCGLEGNISSSVFPAGRLLREKEIIQAAIISLNIEKFSVELDAREESTHKDWMIHMAKLTLDETFREDREKDDREKRPIPRIVKPKQTRHVAHPYWKNISYQEAIEKLSPPEVIRGSAIIRPSTKGNNHLSITWKIDNGIFQHIDILEEDKENELSVGRILKIEDETFEDLDEILECYIGRIASNFNDAMSHSKYRKGSVSDLAHYIEQQVKTLKRSTYGITICPEKPGRLYLVYQHHTGRTKTESIMVSNKGFHFRNVVFKQLDALFDGFKKMESVKAKEAARSNRPAMGGSSSLRHGGTTHPAMRSGTSGSSMSGYQPPRHALPPAPQGDRGYSNQQQWNNGRSSNYQGDPRSSNYHADSRPSNYQTDPRGRPGGYGR